MGELLTDEPIKKKGAKGIELVLDRAFRIAPMGGEATRNNNV
jgi:hypothetical protein